MNLGEFSIFLENRIEDLGKKIKTMKEFMGINPDQKSREILKITRQTYKQNKYMLSSLYTFLKIHEFLTAKVIVEGRFPEL